MLDSIDASSQQFLSAMENLNKRLERAQREVSSGKKIETASDAPDQISELLTVRSDIAQNQQIRDNLASYGLEESVASNALQQASGVLDSVKSAAAVAISGSPTPEMQNNLVQEIESYMQDMVGIAGTKVNGRYIFSGDSDQSAPYTLDLTRANGVSGYAGTATTRQAEHPDGSSFALSKTGQEVFDSATPGESVFAALAGLRQALLANNPAGVQNALASLQTAQDHLQSEAVFYGAAQNRITQATDYATNKDNQLQTRLSAIQDADVTAAILELQDAQFQRQAALSARAKVPPTSLFDYLGKG
jgi:flagellar hook-associated protein 3 FlgL